MKVSHLHFLVDAYFTYLKTVSTCVVSEQFTKILTFACLAQ